MDWIKLAVFLIPSKPYKQTLNDNHGCTQLLFLSYVYHSSYEMSTLSVPQLCSDCPWIWVSVLPPESSLSTATTTPQPLLSLFLDSSLCKLHSDCSCLLCQSAVCHYDWEGRCHQLIRKMLAHGFRGYLVIILCLQQHNSSWWKLVIRGTCSSHDNQETETGRSQAPSTSHKGTLPRS